MKARTIIKRLMYTCLFLLFVCSIYAQNSHGTVLPPFSHPRLLTNNTQKERIWKLVRSHHWALKAYNDIRQSIDPYVDRRWLRGEIGSHIVTARRSGEDWFVGMLTNTEARNLQVPLKFLDKNKKYIAHIYVDDEKMPTKTKVAV